MTSPEKRRPLPALVLLVALTLVTGLVWIRVLHRSDNSAKASSNSSCGNSPSSSSSASSSASPSPTPTPTFSVLPTPSTVSVLVLNSTTHTGVAGLARKALIADGFVSSQAAANDDADYGGHGEIPGVAEIRYGPKAAGGAALLAYYFPTATLRATADQSAIVIVSLGAKYTKPATPAVVKAALAAHHITLSPTPPVSSPSPSPSPSC